MNDIKLDAPYFKKKLKLIIRDVNHYTPDEMARELSTLAETAQPVRCDECGLPRELEKIRRNSNGALMCAECQELTVPEIKPIDEHEWSDSCVEYVTLEVDRVQINYSQPVDDARLRIADLRALAVALGFELVKRESKG
jgi:hypothetical protein